MVNISDRYKLVAGSSGLPAKNNYLGRMYVDTNAGPTSSGTAEVYGPVQEWISPYGSPLSVIPTYKYAQTQLLVIDGSEGDDLTVVFDGVDDYQWIWFHYEPSVTYSFMAWVDVGGLHLDAYFYEEDRWLGHSTKYNNTWHITTTTVGSTEDISFSETDTNNAWIKLVVDPAGENYAANGYFRIAVG